MAQYGRSLSFNNAGRFKLRIPRPAPSTFSEVAENFSTLKGQYDALPLPVRFGWDLQWKGADQSIATGTPVNLAMDTAVYDNNGFWKNQSTGAFVVANNIVQVPPGGAGLYWVYGYALWDIVTSVLGPQLLIAYAPAGAGAQQIVCSNAPNQPATVAWKSFVSMPMALNDGDRLGLGVFHSSAAARNIVTTSGDSSTNSPGPLFRGYRFAVYG